MSNKTAFLFPGQGSQFVGMGRDLKDQYPSVKKIFEQVDDICQKPISKLCFEGPMDELTVTKNLQPAITAMNLACLTVLKEAGKTSAVSAGHSLGEYAALVSAGALSNYDALRLVHKRGALMHREAKSNPGDMVAVIGMDMDGLNEIFAEIQGDGILAVANHNTAEQIVITGEKEPVAQAARIVKERTGRAIPLKVSGAWHCELMRGAVDEFRAFVGEINFSEPQSVVLFNATGKKETNPEKIKDIMANQLVSPVKWYDIIRTMLKAGVEEFVEVGPKTVLTGLLKKIITDEKVDIYNVQDAKSLKQYVEG